MKLIKDKEFFKVTKDELKNVKGIENTKKALKLIKLNKGLFCLVCLFFVFTVAINTINALVAQQMLQIFTTGEFEKFTYFAFVFLVFNLLTYLIGYGQEYFYDKFKKQLTFDLKINIYNRINTLTAGCFLNNQTSTFTRRLYDSNEVSFAFDIVFNTIQSLTISLAYCIILATSNPLLFVVCALFYLIKDIAMRYVVPRHNVIRKKIRKTADEANNVLLESIRGANDIKSLNLANNVKDKFEEKIDLQNSQALSSALWYRNRMTPANILAFPINAFVFMLLVSFVVTNNIYEGSTILFFYSYRSYINSFFKNLFDIKLNFSNIEVATSRIMELYDEEKFPSEKFGNKVIDVKGNIKFKNVSFSYEKNKPVLKDINLNIEANKITAFVGKTGCGKSTTLSLIAKFMDPKKGTITLDGTNIKSLTKDCLRNNIGYVQQMPYIFNCSFKENLLLVKPNATQEEIEDACKKSEIHDFIMTTTNKYDTLIGENGITLSGGQRQRLAIARALLNNSKIIMFDESTSSLDNENQAKIQSVIENLSKDHTIIVVAHRLSTIINADKIIFMDDHKIIAEGTHNELFENCEGYRKLYEIELN